MAIILTVQGHGHATHIRCLRTLYDDSCCCIIFREGRIGVRATVRTIVTFAAPFVGIALCAAVADVLSTGVTIWDVYCALDWSISRDVIGTNLLWWHMSGQKFESHALSVHVWR